MRLTKIEKAERLLNESFCELLREKFAERFGGLAVETQWNIFTMNLVTKLESGDDFSSEQHQWVAAFSEGYAQALAVVSGIEGGAARALLASKGGV